MFRLHTSYCNNLVIVTPV